MTNDDRPRAEPHPDHLGPVAGPLAGSVAGSVERPVARSDEGERVVAARRLTAAAVGRAALDQLAELAARLLGTPSAQLSLLSDVQVIAASAGLPTGATQAPSPLADSLCTVTAAGHVPLVVTDARTDDRVAHLPPVTGGAVGSYLGVPLTGSGGHTVGALCVFSPQARDWSDVDVGILAQLAAAATAEMELSALSAEHRTSEVVLDLAVSAASIGIFDIDVLTGTRSFDDRLLEIFGYSRDDVTGRLDALEDRMHPDDLPWVQRRLARAIRDCGTYEAEYRVVHPDGRVRWVAARGRALCDEHGRTTRVLGAAQDITAMREGEAHTASILESMAVAYLALDADWRITYLNARAEQIAGATREDLVGREFWDAFPAAVGTEFERRYRAVAATGQVAVFDAYYPEPLDVWVEVRATRENGGVALYFLDVTSRRRAQEAAEQAVRTQAAEAQARAGLVAIAQALGDAEDEQDVLDVVSDTGVPLFAAVGSGLILRAGDGGGEHLRGLSKTYTDDVRAQMHSVPPDFPLPAVHCAVTGTPYFLRDRAAATALFPGSEPLQEAGGVEATGSVPLYARGRLLGCLSFGMADAREWLPGERELLTALASLTAQALDRLAARDAERAASRAAARFSETLQRSLLTSPPEPEHLHIAVRYSPAAADAQVGGDWYDAFTTGTGATSLVIGDVSGHDQHAAAAMGQLRNLLRGIGYAVGQPPAAVLTILDRSVRDLGVGAMATVVLAQIERSAEGTAGAHVLRWSNAGHPPPLLRAPDGTVRFLQAPPDLVIGIDPGTDRCDHTVVLERGACVLLYTDGLIERRRAHLEAGMAWLAETVGALGDVGVDELCDHLLAAVGDDVEDDIALLALRSGQ